MNHRLLRRPLLFLLLSLLLSSAAVAGGKVGLYGVHLTPYGEDAKDYSGPGWGFGMHAVFPVAQLAELLAGTVGVEYTNLMSATLSTYDPVTGLRVDQETSQGIFRFFLGAQFGGHGNGFLRPHAGANIALEYYSFKVDIVVPDDYNREREIRQSLTDAGQVVFGYDLTLGLDLNFNNGIALDGGVRYIKSFSVPQQLGPGSVKVYPNYFQVYLGIGASFDMLSGE
jgi:hypothetical protein